MTLLLRAALEPVTGILAIVEPSKASLVPFVDWPGVVLVVTSSARRARVLRSWCQDKGEGRFCVLRSSDKLPFARKSLDGCALLGGLPQDGLPREAILQARQHMAVGGTFAVQSRVREGVVGGATSFIKRALKTDPVPRPSDITAWMLQSGLRPVRQVALKGLMFPAVLTWAKVDSRPWE